MQSAHEILARIRWDKQFSAHADFEVGYYDRLEQAILKTPFKDIRFPQDDHFAFEIVDDENNIYTIPYHRVKEIYRNGQLIWHRGC